MVGYQSALLTPSPTAAYFGENGIIISRRSSNLSKHRRSSSSGDIGDEVQGIFTLISVKTFHLLMGHHSLVLVVVWTGMQCSQVACSKLVVSNMFMQELEMCFGLSFIARKEVMKRLLGCNLFLREMNESQPQKFGVKFQAINLQKLRK